MIRILKSLSVFIVLGFQVAAYAQDRPGLGVMDITPLNLNDETLVSAAKVISQLVSHELAATGVYEMVERERLQDILREQGFGLTGCTTDSCVIEIGRLLNAPKMAVGTLGRLGRRYVLTMRIIDVELGIWESHAVEEGIYELEDLGKLVRPLVVKIVEPEESRRAEEDIAPAGQETKAKQRVSTSREELVPSRGKETRFLISFYYNPVIPSTNAGLAGYDWGKSRTGTSLYALLQRFEGEGRIWWGGGLTTQYFLAKPNTDEYRGSMTSLGVFLFGVVGGPGGGVVQADAKVGAGIIRHEIEFFTNSPEPFTPPIENTAHERKLVFLGAAAISVPVSRWLSLSAGVQFLYSGADLDRFGFGRSSITYFSLQTGVTVTL